MSRMPYQLLRDMRSCTIKFRGFAADFCARAGKILMYKQIFGVIGLTAMSSTAFAQEAPVTPLRPDQVAYRALYKELVETNTTLSAGSCTLAAQRIATHLKAAGFTGKDLTSFSVPDHPKEGGL